MRLPKCIIQKSELANQLPFSVLIRKPSEVQFVKSSFFKANRSRLWHVSWVKSAKRWPRLSARLICASKKRGLFEKWHQSARKMVSWSGSLAKGEVRRTERCFCLVKHLNDQIQILMLKSIKSYKISGLQFIALPSHFEVTFRFWFRFHLERLLERRPVRRDMQAAVSALQAVCFGFHFGVLSVTCWSSDFSLKKSDQRIQQVNLTNRLKAGCNQRDSLSDNMKKHVLGIAKRQLNEQI